jgi:CPA1 family monovalent cation:H+ antiporter
MNIPAAVIASYGLLENSPAVVIGAMIIAMLLGPIGGTALALVDGDTTPHRSTAIDSEAEVAMKQGPGVTVLDAAAILVVLAAVLGYVNHRVLRLPPSVGLTAMGAVASLGVIGVDHLLPRDTLGPVVVAFIDGIDFHATLMDGLLSFLLFAGALHIDWSDMKRGRWPILALSTGGVLLSTGLIGGGFYLIAHVLHLSLPWVWCLLFGAIISPTDPVAVMGVLKTAKVAPTLSATVAGESLFNDGVGVVVFTIILAIASGAESFSAGHVAILFFTQAIGGLVLGLAVGWLALQAMRTIDDYNLEVTLTLALVMGGYALARALHVSGPVAMAAAGLLVGNHGVREAMSATTRDHLLKFWSLIDEILNSVLFLLIGLVVVTVPFDRRTILVGIAAIPLALAARAVSVLLPLLLLRPFASLGRAAPVTLIWGGLRGGISVALALSLPDGPARPATLTATYIIVLFSVIVQGCSIGWLIERMSPVRARPN